MLLLTLPILIPLTSSAACLILFRQPRAQAALALASALGLVVAAVALLVAVHDGAVIATQIGGWDAPFGITIVADRLAAILVVLASVAALATTIASIGVTDCERARHGHYPLMLALFSAVCGAFLAGDLFNLYVWFEALLLSSFVLVTLGGERSQLEGAVKYVTLNLLSSVFFLAAVGLLYGITGTLNFAHLALRIDGLTDPTMATAAGMLLLCAFAVKAAAFPYFFWLPASYHTPPPVVSAMFAAVLTKVGVYALIRTSTLLFDHAWPMLGPGLLVIAGLTMAIGVLGAASQMEFRRILAFHSVSQVGYMLMGLAIALTCMAMLQTEDSGGTLHASEAAIPERILGLDPALGASLGLAGAIYFIVHHGLVKMNLFLISAAVLQREGTTDLKRLGGLLKVAPSLAVMFLIASLALAGIPILSGFWAKLSLVYGALVAGLWPIVATALAVSILTLFSMIKIWIEAFWKDLPETRGNVREVDAVAAWGVPRLLSDTAARRVLFSAILGLNIVIVAIGLFAGPIFSYTRTAAADLLNPQTYIDTVLGHDPLLPNAPASPAPVPDVSDDAGDSEVPTPATARSEDDDVDVNSETNLP